MFQTAKTLSQRPSQLTGINDDWAALQFDNAVVYFGTVIENASQEQINVGDDKSPRYRRKYTMAQLLTDGFRIDTEPDEADIDGLRGVEGALFDEVR